MTRLRYLASFLLLNFDPSARPAWGGNELPASRLEQVDSTVMAQTTEQVPPGDVVEPKKVASDKAPGQVQEPTNPGPRPNAAAADLAKIQGVWSIERYEEGGQSLSIKCDPLVARDTDLIFRGEHWMLHEPGKVMAPYAVIKLQPETEPKQVDFILVDGTSIVAGIYKFEEDRLILCLADAGQPIRPTQFTTRENLPIGLVVCRRLGDVGPNQGLGVPKEGDKQKEDAAAVPVIAPLSQLYSARAAKLQGDDEAKELAYEVPDLTTEELAGLTIEQLQRLAKSYASASFAVVRDLHGEKLPKPNAGAKEIEAARGLVFDFLPTKSRLPSRDRAKPSGPPNPYHDDSMRIHRISTAILNAFTTKILSEAK